MKFAKWPLAKYRDLDKKVNALIKKITKFPNSFPTALIYMDKEHGGLNFKRLSDSDAVHIAKLSPFHRYQGPWDSTSLTAAVMCGLIGRAPRTAGLRVPPFESCSITDTGKGWWASCFVEWLKLNGLYIDSAGDTPGAAPTERDVLESVSHLTHSRRAELEHVDASVRVRQGQCWIFELTEPLPPTVYEIMGFKKVQGKLMVNVLAWQTTTPNRHITPEDTVAMLETTHTGFHRGAGTSCFKSQGRLGTRGIR